MINLQNKTEQEQTQVAEPTTAQTPKENFSLAECRQGYIDDFKKTGELEKYTAKIEVFDPNSIVKFGSEAAEEVSKSADVVLNGMNIDQINNSGKMLEALDKIMGSFDIDEVKEDKGLYYSTSNDFRIVTDGVVKENIINFSKVMGIHNKQDFEISHCVSKASFVILSTKHKTILYTEESVDKVQALLKKYKEKLKITNTVVELHKK